jgi:Na+/melibiose symporter-like transporter
VSRVSEIVFAIFYPLGRARHASLRAELARREATQAQPDEG